MLLLAAVSQAQIGETYHVHGFAVSLREAPSKQTASLAKLTPHTNVTILELHKGGWFKVTCESGTGFLPTGSLEKGKAVMQVQTVRIGAVCRDGSRSDATGPGACSYHGGVDHWVTGEQKNVRIEAD